MYSNKSMDITHVCGMMSFQIAKFHHSTSSDPSSSYAHCIELNSNIRQRRMRDFRTFPWCKDAARRTNLCVCEREFVVYNSHTHVHLCPSIIRAYTLQIHTASILVCQFCTYKCVCVYVCSCVCLSSRYV